MNRLSIYAPFWIAATRCSIRQLPQYLQVLRRSFSCTDIARVATCWTAEEDDRLTALSADGQTSRVIGQQLGRSPLAVQGRLHTLRTGASARRFQQRHTRWSTMEDEKLKDLKSRGLTYIQCLPYFVGRSEQSLRRRWTHELRQQQHGSIAAKNHHRWSTAECAQVIQSRETQGLSFDSIADKIGRTRSSVQQMYYRHTEPASRPKVQVEGSYTAEEDARIGDLLQRGHSHSAIAKALRRTTNGVRIHIHLRGDRFDVAHHPRLSKLRLEELREEVTKARGRSLSRREIFKLFPDVSPNTLDNYIYKREKERTDATKHNPRP